MDWSVIVESELAEAFNTWLGEYIEFPEKFQEMRATMDAAIAEASSGQEPSYGASCVALLKHYVAGGTLA